MAELLSEAIEVGAVFGPGSIRPKWFLRNGRKYDIKEITYTWRSRQGNFIVFHFTVSDGANVFDISLDQKTMAWSLDRTE